MWGDCSSEKRVWTLERRALAVHSLGAERHFLRFQFGPFGSPRGVVSSRAPNIISTVAEDEGDNFPAIQEIRDLLGKLRGLVLRPGGIGTESHLSTYLLGDFYI